MKLNFNTYNKKVRGCFVGKSVGGTLGMKYEGNLNFNEVTYYNPVPTKMIPNDDLDLQVVNLERIMNSGLPVCRYYLGECWKYNIADHAPDEYAIAVSNNALKIFAPLSGIYRNKFNAGMGGAIRSELWACLAPANPSLSAIFAREDACTDHYADGTYAAMFLAAVESAAFVENDLIKLIDIGLGFIPDGSKLKNAFNDTISWWNETKDILAVRKLILENYKNDNWTDVIINLSFILLSLLCCEGSFDKAVCTAASLGYDADCTAATVGSIFGIMNPDGIDKKWTNPIGDALVLSSSIINMHEPKTIDAFCDSIISVAGEVEKYYNTNVELSIPDDFFKACLNKPWTNIYDIIHGWEEGINESIVSVKPLLVSMIYPKNVAALYNSNNEYTLKLTNILESKVDVSLSLFAPEGFVLNFKDNDFTLDSRETVELPFTIFVDEQKSRSPLNVLKISIEINGIPFDLSAGIPISNPWYVESLETGEKSVFEAESLYFKVPKGKYKYTAKFNSPSDKVIRICSTGTSDFKLFLNGDEVVDKKDKFYVPGFHRGRYFFKVNVKSYENIVDVYFDNDEETEFFFGMSTDFGCAMILDTMERYL